MKIIINNNKAGYTLVEMAVVVVIIGLITAGLMGANSLIESARRNTLIKDIEQIEAAVNAFQLRYDSLPGDMNNASSYWGTDCDSTPTDCDGDGDDKIEQNLREGMRAWQHMSLAEIYPGGFTGEGDGGTNIREIGVNIPQSNMADNVGYNFVLYTFTFYSDATDTQLIHAGSEYSNGSTKYNWGGFISGKDAYAVDKKVDEGDPDSGRLLAFNAYVSGSSSQLSRTSEDSCVDANITDSTTSVEYYKTTDNKSCFLGFKLLNASAKGEF